jgi:hypothetical protein
LRYTVLRDTREQQGWTFAESQYCEGTVDATLATGDYTLLGYEKFLTIERKGSSGEFARNVVEKRFERELERMEACPHSFMVLEFTMDDLIGFPKNSGIPVHLWPKLRMSSFFLIKRFMEFQFQYKTRIILAGKHGKDIASSIFKRTVEHYVKQQKAAVKRIRKTAKISKG